MTAGTGLSYLELTVWTMRWKAIKTGKMKGTVYNDKEDQAMELAKLSVEIVCGKDTNRKHLKEGRYYVSEYCRVDSSNVDHFLK